MIQGLTGKWRFVAYGAAAGLLAFVVTWIVQVGMCAMTAGETTILPSPASWTMRGIRLAVGVAVGIVAGLRANRKGATREDAFKVSRVSLGTVLVLVSISFVIGFAQESAYADHVPPGMDRQKALVYGHRACNWLARRPWGRPPGPEHLSRSRAAPARGLVYYDRGAGWNPTNSTSRLFVYYYEHVDRQTPGPLTREEREQYSVTAAAWYELCPWQQFIHRPVGGGGGGD